MRVTEQKKHMSHFWIILVSDTAESDSENTYDTFLNSSGQWHRWVWLRKNIWHISELFWSVTPLSLTQKKHMSHFRIILVCNTAESDSESESSISPRSLIQQCMYMTLRIHLRIIEMKKKNNGVEYLVNVT